MTRIALLGCGTVGSAVARRLAQCQATPFGLCLTLVFDRRAAAKAARLALPRHPPVAWTTRFDDILRGDADIVVEAVGGIEPAAAWIREALLAGKSVVTANKQVVARHGPALWTLAERQGRQFRFEAAVGGAMPIVRTIGEGLAGDRITRIVAILNGTTNAVLSMMEATGCSLADALVEARAKGYAEADPAADLDGHDARAKLAILCGLAFGVRVNPACIAARSAAGATAGDFERARRRGGTLRQIAYADFDRQRSRLTAGVTTRVVATGSIFARTTGAQNAAVITGEHAGEIGIFGAGAGGDATAVAVISDVAAIARDRAAIIPAPRLSSDFTMHDSDTAFELQEAV